MTAISRKQDVTGFVCVTQQVTGQGGQVFVGKVGPETLIARVDLVVTEPFQGTGAPPTILVGDEKDPQGWIAPGDVDAAQVGAYQGGQDAPYRGGKYYPDQERIYIAVEQDGPLDGGACHAVLHCVPLAGLVS